MCANLHNKSRCPINVRFHEFFAHLTHLPVDFYIERDVRERCVLTEIRAYAILEILMAACRRYANSPINVWKARRTMSILKIHKKRERKIAIYDFMLSWNSKKKKQQRHPHLWSCSWKTRTTELIGGDRALCHFSIAAGDRQCNTFLVIDSSWCLDIDQNHHTDSHCHWKFRLVSWRLHRALKKDGKYRKSTTNIFREATFPLSLFFLFILLQLYLTFQSPKL